MDRSQLLRGTLDAAALADATAELERIRALVDRVGWFAQLQLHAEASEERSAELQRAQELLGPRDAALERARRFLERAAALTQAAAA